MTGWAMVDGRPGPLAEAALPVSDLGFQRGWSVFETLELLGDQDPSVHLERLRRSAEVALVPMPEPALLREELRAMMARFEGRAWVRITLTASGHRVITATPADLSRWHQPVAVARGQHVDDPFLPGSVKHGSRIGWEVEVTRSGVDDVLRVDTEGCFTEGTRSGVLAVVAGVILTAPHDGRILPSTTVTRLVAHARALGLPVERRGAAAQGPWDALYIASSTRSLAPVIAIDGEALPPWDPVGRALADADDAWAGR